MRRRTRITVLLGAVLLLMLGLLLTACTVGIDCLSWDLSALPLRVCLRADDVACSTDFFLGRDGWEHIDDLVLDTITFLGCTFIAIGGTSALRARRPSAAVAAPGSRSGSNSTDVAMLGVPDGKG